jgi:hypothetical protein
MRSNQAGTECCNLQKRHESREAEKARYEAAALSTNCISSQKLPAPKWGVARLAGAIIEVASRSTEQVICQGTEPQRIQHDSTSWRMLEMIKGIEGVEGCLFFSFPSLSRALNVDGFRIFRLQQYVSVASLRLGCLGLVFKVLRTFAESVISLFPQPTLIHGTGLDHSSQH